MSLKTAMIRASQSEDARPSTIVENMVATGSYCSFPCTTTEEKKRVFNAINAADMRLRSAVNMKINVTGVYIEPVELGKQDAEGNPVYVVREDGSVVEEDGEPVQKTDICPRMVIFADDGKTYGCCSFGAYNAMKRIFNLFGTPDTWAEPVTIIPQIVDNGKKQILTISLG